METNHKLNMLKVNQQPTCKIKTQNYIQYMGDHSRSIPCETNKENKAKHKLGFLDNNLHTHTEACVRRPYP